MTTTSVPNAQVWLVKESTLLGSFVVWADCDRIGRAVATGHRVVVVETVGMLKRVGCILGVRAELEARTLCFDQLHVVKTVGSLADLGLTLLPGLVTRLHPEGLSVVLARDGGSSSNDVPLIQDATHVRDLLELATHYVLTVTATYRKAVNNHLCSST